MIVNDNSSTEIARSINEHLHTILPDNNDINNNDHNHIHNINNNVNSNNNNNNEPTVFDRYYEQWYR